MTRYRFKEDYRHVTAKHAFENPGPSYYISGRDDIILLSGIDMLVDGSKVILEYGSTGEKLVAPDFEVLCYHES